MGSGIMLGAGYLFRLWGVVALLTLAAGAARSLPNFATPNLSAPNNEPTVEDLKAKVPSASIGDRPHLCVQIAQKQLMAADQLYADSEVEKGQAALVDVVAYSELARDYAIQSHKYQKQSEIAVRSMTRRLGEILHLVGHDDQAPVRDAIDRLQRVRDDLLKAMFPKGAK
jgi:hypothetical protein